MKWWQRLFGERRAQEQWTLSELTSWSDMGIGPGPTSAGLTVTPECAVREPAVFSCVRVLSQDLARTPMKFRRRLDQDTFEDATDHVLWEVLGSLPNPECTAFEFKNAMMQNLLTYERAYAEIVRTDGRVTALWLLDPCRMRIERDGTRRKVYHYTLGNGQTKTWVFDASQPPILELHHPSPIAQCRDLIGTALALQTYVAKFFANGGRPSGAINVTGTLSDKQMAQLRADWTATYSGASNAHKTAILEGGMQFQPIAPTNDASQLNETLQSIRTEIAAAFRIPVWKIGDLSNANYSNMESSGLDYINSTLDPFFTLWEEAIRRDVLTVRQYNTFSVTFDRSALIRSAVKDATAALATGRQNGWWSANDVRRKLGENPIPADQGGDDYLVNSALVPGREAQEGNPNAA